MLHLQYLYLLIIAIYVYKAEKEKESFQLYIKYNILNAFNLIKRFLRII